MQLSHLKATTIQTLTRAVPEWPGHRGVFRLADMELSGRVRRKRQAQTVHDG